VKGAAAVSGGQVGGRRGLFKIRCYPALTRGEIFGVVGGCPDLPKPARQVLPLLRTGLGDEGSASASPTPRRAISETPRWR